MCWCSSKCASACTCVAETDEYGNKFKKGEEVFDGHYLEEEHDAYGPGKYKVYRSTNLMIRIDAIIGIDWDTLPVRARLMRLTEDSGEATSQYVLRLDEVEHREVEVTILGRGESSRSRELNPSGGGASGRPQRTRRAPRRGH